MKMKNSKINLDNKKVLNKYKEVLDQDFIQEIEQYDLDEDQSDFVRYFMNKYKRNRDFILNQAKSNKEDFNSLSQSLRSKNGKVYECINAHLVDKMNFKILYADEVIPKCNGLVRPDLVFQASERKIFLSLKTSIRERWKQADWEAIYAKENYPDWLFVLCIHDQKEAERLEKSLSYLSGLDSIICSSDGSLNEFYKNL